MSRQAGNGSLLAIVVVIVILLVGAFYVWRLREQPTSPDSKDNTVAETDMADTQEASLLKQSSSDDLGSIETDLGATSFEAL